MILPAKGMLPVGSYIGSPGFGLIHPNTITAAVLQNAGFVREDDNPDNPMRFDAFALAPNFDIPTGRGRMVALNGMITDWELYEAPEEEYLVCIPPEDLTPKDLFDFQNVPVQLAYRDHLSPQLHEKLLKLPRNILRISYSRVTWHPCLQIWELIFEQCFINMLLVELD